MPANLEQRGETWYFRGKIAGKVHRISTGFKVGTKRSADLAQRRALEIATEIRAEARGYVKKECPTFTTWAAQFLRAYYPHTDGTRNTEASFMRRPAAKWGDRRLNTITRTDVEMFFRERESAGAKGGTLERERVVLKRCFRAALDDGLIDKNPMTGLKAFKTKPKTRVMSKDEEARIREAILPAWQRFLTVALATGLRLSELMGLRPDDLRENGTWLWVRPELNKTRTGRLVPLREEARTALAEQAAWRQGDGEADPTRPYWGQCKGAAYISIKRACDRLKITPHIGIHDLRRTFATRMAAAKVYPKHLQLILGHRDISTTMKYYVHEERQSLADAMTEVKL